MQLRPGRRYAGRIELEGFDRFASRGLLREKFTQAGFSDVRVSDNTDAPAEIPSSLRADGTGVRYATGTWTGADLAVELPDQVKALVDLTPAGAPTRPPAREPSAPLGPGEPPVRLNVSTLPRPLEQDFIFIILAVRLGLYFL